MASLQRRASGRYRIIFCYSGKRFFISLKTKSPKEANASLARVEENLHDLERGRLSLPPEADLDVFLLSDGKLLQKPVIERSITLREMFEHYRENHPAGAKEANTRYTERIHLNHLERLIGPGVAVRTITAGTLQTYVQKRSAECVRGGKAISHETIKKEIGTFTSVWNKWAEPHGFVSGPSPTKDLVYSKKRAKPPFQTLEQIARRTARGGLTEEEIDELWDAVFLGLAEIGALLDHVRKQDRWGFVYPMFCFAAYTGARRSEMLRSQVDDFDFATGTVVIREKKRDRSRALTFRTVPLSPFLISAMKSWLCEHPGGQHLLCAYNQEPVTVQMAAHHFRNAVEGSSWERLSGWHVLRHSFCSNLASKGVDQRLIDAWMGHHTEEMRQRYRHLFPNQEQEAIRLAFG